MASRFSLAPNPSYCRHKQTKVNQYDLGLIYKSVIFVSADGILDRHHSTCENWSSSEALGVILQLRPCPVKHPNLGRPALSKYPARLTGQRIRIQV